MHVPDVVPARDGERSSRREHVAAWRPSVPGVAEVLHARFVGHVYPAHTHDTWTLLLVEDGAVRFDLDRVEHAALRAHVTVLPPHVPHTGRAGTDGGFRKRVLYVDDSVLGAELVGAAADGPSPADPLLRVRVGQLHDALSAPGEELEAESRLTLVAARLRAHLAGRVTPQRPAAGGLAADLRDLLDSRVVEGLTLREAGTQLGAHPDSLVRAFTTAFGLPPHRYLTGRRVDLARRLLLAGRPLAEVAAAAGFHDQAHLTRHFRRQVGAPPGRFARGSA